MWSQARATAAPSRISQIGGTRVFAACYLPSLLLPRVQNRARARCRCHATSVLQQDGGCDLPSAAGKGPLAAW